MENHNNKEGENGWNEYGRLVLKELERLNKEVEELKELKNKYNYLEDENKELKKWKGSVDEVMSPTQMKEIKDEVYKQKNKWTSAIAIITFIQILITASAIIITIFF